MRATQKMINESATIVKQMQTENEKGNNIIQSIMLLDTTEANIKAIKTRIKAYGVTIQRRLTASATSTPATTSVTLSNNIKEIQVKLDKMNIFTKTTKEIF